MMIDFKEMKKYILKKVKSDDANILRYHGEFTMKKNDVVLGCIEKLKVTIPEEK